TASQTYTGPVTLGVDTTLIGTRVETGNTVTGAGQSWTVDADAQIGGDVMGVNSLSITGNTRLGGNISTTGDQTYAGTLRLLGDAALTSTGNTGAITLSSDIDSVTTARALVVDATGTASRAVIASTVGNAPGLSALSVRAADIVLSTANVQTSGEQSYTGAITLGADTGLTASTVRIGSGSDITGAGKNLTLTGNASIGGQISGMANLMVTGNTELGAQISTTAQQQYGGTLSLYADTRLNASSIGIGGAINADTAGAQGLSLDTGAGALTLSYEVGGLRPLKDLAVKAGQINLPNGQITTMGAQVFDGPVALTNNARLSASLVRTKGTVTGSGSALQVDGSAQFDDLVSGLSAVKVNGASQLSANVSTTGDQTYTGAVTLSTDTTLSANKVVLGATLQGGGHGLVVGGSGGLVTGGELAGLRTLQVDHNATLGGGVSSTGSQIFGGPLLLAGDANLLATGVAAVIRLDGPVDSAAGPTARALGILLSGAGGQVIVDSAIGANAPLSTLSVVAPDVRLNTGSVQTTGAQSYGGQLTLNQATVLTGQSVATTTGTVVQGVGQSLRVNGDADLAGQLSALASLDVSGATRLAASVSTTAGQTYGGAVTLSNNSTLADLSNVRFLGDVNALTTAGASLTVNAGGNVTFTGDVGAAQPLASLAIDSASVNAVRLAVRDQLQVAVSDVNALSTLSGAVSGAANGLLKRGAGVLRLTGGNGYTGDTRIDAGTLVLAGAATLGQGNYTGAMVLAKGSVFQFDSSAPQDMAGAISGAGQVKQSGTGVLSLSGANTYSGGTLMTAGVLEAASAGALGQTGDLTFSGGTLRYSANNQTDYSARLSGAANGYRVDTAGQNVTFATALVGSTASLEKLGSGTLTLTGANSYAGDTLVSAGKLLLNGSAQLGGGQYGGAIRLAGGATLQLDSDQPQTFSGVISGAGNLLKNSANTTLTLTGENTYTGETQISAGQLRVGNGGASGNLGTGALTLGEAVELAIHKSSGVNIANSTITGMGRMYVQSDHGDVLIGARVNLTGAQSTVRVDAPAGDVRLLPGTVIQVAANSPSTDVGAIHLVGKSFTNNAGASALALTSHQARWLVQTESPALDVKGNLNYQFKQYGASASTTPLQSSGNGLLYRVTPEVNVVLQGVTRVYDKTDVALPVNSNFSYSGTLLDGDQITMLQPMTNMPGFAARYAGINALDHAVTLNNAQFETTDAAGAKVYGYQSTQGRTVVGTGNITPFMLGNVFDVIPKIYDGSTTANVVTAPGLGPLFAGDVVGANYVSADYNSKDVVSANQVTILGGTLVGPDARNYTLPAITRINAGIATKTVSLSASKIYDGTTNLTGAVDLQTGVGNEVLGYSGAVASDAHVSTLNKYVVAINLTDGTTALQSNYRLPSLNNLNAPVQVLARPVRGQAAIVGEFDKVFNNDVDVDPKKVSLLGQVSGAVTGDTLVLDFAPVGLAYVSKQVGSTQIGTQGLADFTLQRSTLLSERSDYAFTPPVIGNVAARINSAFTVPPVATLVQVQAPQVAAPVSTLIQSDGLAAAP
ncbi:autotransporter-associated beta strand repeat-containing protein, partial [Limnohabitans sp.]|uniref:beta strand repeat-containing protein n=1 Tax=Limnohabitans sp. TaxID=1907725 RepID=UPI00289D353E